MRLVVFGLSVSSSWGNGHATLWRGLIAALLRAGHRITFFERDTPWYAEHRDLHALPEGGRLVIYPAWAEVLPTARQALADADAALVTSFCPDGVAASRLVMDSAVAVRGFYDMDTPVTLARRAAGDTVPDLPPEGLQGFDVVLSFAGGPALAALRTQLGARRVVPFHGWVDPDLYAPAAPRPEFAADLSYLGTYAADRQAALERLLVATARACPARRFVIGGAQYPRDFPWAPNIFFVRHLPPGLHAAFYAASRLTLNVTRGPMARMGWCPSGRMFEAAACGVPIVSDAWPGLDAFFAPGREILVAGDTDDVRAALDLPAGVLAEMAARARGRVLDEHTAACRARQLVALLRDASGVAPAPAEEAR